MDSVALYRRYRSQDFGELIGQDHVAKTLENAIAKNRISHAYLFTGPRGTGKTSAARIFAKRINKISSDDVHDEVDIIEIDAASNNGVDEIRDLREKVHIAPNYRDYKVYIIDEVHMLSGAAFNALLKTLEEPPSHVIFILATTEPHKLPPTISSRTQHFPFHPIPRDILSKHLHKISKSEKINIDKEALDLISEIGEGSARDAISMLDQLAGKTEAVTAEQVRAMVGIVHNEHLVKLMEAAINQKTKDMLQLLDEILESGSSPRNLSKQLLDITRQYIREHINDDGIKLYNAKRLLSALSSVPGNAPHLAVAIESALLGVSHSSAPQTENEEKPRGNFQQRVQTADAPVKKEKEFGASPAATAHPQSDESPETEDGNTVDKFKQETKKKTQAEKQEKPTKQKATSNTQSKPSEPNKTNAGGSTWVKALSIIKNQNTSLYGIARNADVDIRDDSCTITVKFQFHYRRLQQEQNYVIIKDALSEANGQKISLNIDMDESSKEDQGEISNDDAIKQVFDILGGEIV